MFHVGQLVVCVKRGEWKLVDGDEIVEGRDPHKGEVLTISGIDVRCGGLYLRFFEIDHSPDEVWYDSNRFRPLPDDRIAIFRQLLVNPHQKVDA